MKKVLAGVYSGCWVSRRDELEQSWGRKSKNESFQYALLGGQTALIQAGSLGSSYFTVGWLL